MYGQMIRQNREAKHLTQEALANLTCIARTTIISWEQEESVPTDARKISRLENALGMKSGELYNAIHNPNPTQTPSRRGRAKDTQAA